MKQFLAIIAVSFLAACSGGGGGKKVLVMVSGNVTVSGNNIELKPGSGHKETTIEPEGDAITVSSPSGTTNYPVPESGFYILNLKNDTLIGSRQALGKEGSTPPQVISQENLKFRIDSLNQLMAGANVNEKGGQYNLAPFSIKKISANAASEVVGPYRLIPASFDPNIEHEVYKFYTNKEMHDLVKKLEKMSE